MNGKGSTPRPWANREQYLSNWDAVFKKPPKDVGTTEVPSVELVEGDEKELKETDPEE